MQLLYVEDDRQLASSVQMILQRRGHFCHTTHLGEEALRLVQRNDYDIVVLDIMLPDIDGYEVLERLEEGGKAPPVLLQSGLADRDSDPQGLGFGVDVFLSKPFTVDEMLERIEQVLNGKKDHAPPNRPPLAENTAGKKARGSERRLYRRFSTLKKAQVLVQGKRLDCVVLNMSHGGAALRISDGSAGNAVRVMLEIAGEIPRGCRICWRVGNKIGVRFL